MTTLPGRTQVRECFVDLLDGRATREEIADWASAWVHDGHPTVADALVWQALRELSTADHRVDGMGYLQSDQQFIAWLARVDQSPN